MSNSPAKQPGIDDVDDLCRLAAAARHLDCRIHLSGAGSELRELIELAGVDDVLVGCPADPDRPPPAPSSPPMGRNDASTNPGLR